MSENKNYDTKISSEERKKITVELKKKHDPWFNSHGIKNPVFLLKTFHCPVDEKTGEKMLDPQGVQRRFVGLYRGDIQNARGNDVYIESTTSSLEPENEFDDKLLSPRNLYKWPFNSHWEEYKDNPCKKGSSARWYLIPIEELILVNPTYSNKSVNKLQTKINFEDEVSKTQDTLTKKFDEDSSKPKDCLISELTALDKMAMDHWVPCSLKPFINEAILKYPEGCH